MSSTSSPFRGSTSTAKKSTIRSSSAAKAHPTQPLARSMLASAFGGCRLTLSITGLLHSTTSSLSASFFRSISSSIRPFSNSSMDMDPKELEALYKKKRSLRSRMRKELQNMSPAQRLREDNIIQDIVLEAPWFKHSKSLCAYISSAALREVDTSKIVREVLSCSSKDMAKKLYVPRVEDRNSNMKMIRISSLDNLVESSMGLLEPAYIDSNGNQSEEVMQVEEPVDLFILPGLAFDRSGKRLGRSGGYYDMYLTRYQEFVEKRKWKKPLLVALAYSIQIREEGEVPVTPNDIPVDAIVSPAGFFPIHQASF